MKGLSSISSNEETEKKMEIHCLRSYVYRSQSTVAWFMHMVGSDDGLQQSV